MRLTSAWTCREVPLDQWDALLAQFPQHTVFHTTAWLEAIRAVYGAKIILGCAEFDGECVAIWPVLQSRKGFLKLLGSPLPGWSTAYMGPLFREGTDPESAMEALLNFDMFRKGSFFAAKVLNEAAPVDLTRHGFERVLDFDTLVLDLTQTTETLWNNLKGECRTRIRKARSLGVEIRSEHDDSFLDEYWAMSLETFANTNIKPTFTLEFAGEVWKRLHAEGRIHALSAWQNGERIGVLMLPFDNHTMYYWGGASWARVRGIPAHNLLHWEAIELAQKLGLRRYDFISTLGGAGRFKRTFGPQTINVATHWERTSSRIVKALRDRYEQYLTLRQKLWTNQLLGDVGAGALAPLLLLT